MKAYYNKTRFKYLDSEIMRRNIFDYQGDEKLYKTATIYDDDLNIYIDTSDGVNEELKINEYCGRILKVIEETKGKKFLYFKSAYSPIWSKDIIDLAEKNNGKVIPFFKWSFNPNFYTDLLPRRKELSSVKTNTSKIHDVGFYSNLKPYTYPKPNKSNKLVSHSDYEKFGYGSKKDTGYYINDSRKNLYNRFVDSDFDWDFEEKIPYKQYLNRTFACKTLINTPGMGEYTSRMVDCCLLGQCLILRKTSYDFGLSHNDYLPQVDFTKEGWQDSLQNIIDNYKEYEQKSAAYFDDCWTPKPMVDFLVNKIEELK